MKENFTYIKKDDKINKKELNVSNIVYTRIKIERGDNNYLTDIRFKK